MYKIMLTLAAVMTMGFAAANVIFIGYPIWWDQARRIINTFIESHDLKGKMLVPFVTSGVCADWKGTSRVSPASPVRAVPG